MPRSKKARSHLWDVGNNNPHPARGEPRRADAPVLPLRLDHHSLFRRRLASHYFSFMFLLELISALSHIFDKGHYHIYNDYTIPGDTGPLF